MNLICQKLREDLRLRGLSKRTIDQYLTCASVFLRYHDVPSVDHLSTEHARAFLLHLADIGRSTSTRAVYHAAMKRLFASVGREADMDDVPRTRVKTLLPGRALTRAEVQALLALLAPHPYDDTFFAVMLATGLRISEAVALQVDDIDRRARLVHVRRGKGDKRRTVMLSPRTLRLLERYWHVVRPRAPFLFPARRVGARNRSWAHHAISAGRMAHRLRTRQGDAPHRVRSHDLRRTFATWLLEDGYDLRHVQVLLGHACPGTTARYARVHADRIAQTRSPFDRV
jgi:integrase